MYKYYLAILIFNLLTLSSHAEVTLDGTLGKSGALTGPNYQIGADLGQQLGPNLFHSFQDFNLHSHESATFSGPNSVQNIISRVTGGNPSTIDGLIRSTIPNADMYFLNPYGIMFGPNAQLDVQGDFHASTADYLRLQDGGRFEARYPNNSLLTVAPIAAFGFLTDSPAPLDLQRSQLTVPIGKTLSLSGGQISLDEAIVTAAAGRVQLASLAQRGEFTLSNPDLSSMKGDTISLRNQAKVTTSGEGGGQILIRGGQLVMDHSSIEAHTLGSQDGQGIDIATHEAVTVTGDAHTTINTPTFGSGKSGDIRITTPRLDVTGSFIDTNSFGSGACGNIDIQAHQVTLQKGGGVGNITYGKGKGGLVRVQARDSITVAGHREGDFSSIGNSRIGADSFGEGRNGEVQIITSYFVLDGATISVESVGLSDANNLTIEADTVVLKNGGVVASDTFGDHTGGNITFKVTGDLIIAHRASEVFIALPPFNLVIDQVQSGISSGTFGRGTAGHITISANRLVMQDGVIAATTIGEGYGKAGAISVTVNELHIEDGGNITSSSGVFMGQKLFLGTGDSGKIDITVNGTLRIQGQNSLKFPSSISSNTLASGNGGSVSIRANRLQLNNGGSITANSIGTGKAGELHIVADILEIQDGGQITTSAQHATGGNIYLTVTDRFHIRKGQLTTSVAMGGTGDGGNIILDQPEFVVLDAGQIKAQADTGNGGNIHIVADQFIATPSSLISASSNKGISGHVVISSPDNNLAGNLLALSKELRSIPTFSEFCEYRTLEEKSSFKVTRHRQSQPSHGDWQAGPQ